MPKMEASRTCSRRAILRGAGAAAGALLATPLLGGCAAGNSLAALEHNFRPVSLTFFLLGGKAVSRESSPLTAFAKPLQGVVEQARQQAGGISKVTFQTGGGDPSTWFPLPSTLYNAGGEPQVRTDDPNIPMPDVVVAMHSMMPDYLANRALDLDPYVKLHKGVLDGIADKVLQQGRAYSATRGTIQASLPVLRIPPLCVVPQGITAVSGGKAWTVDAFVQALQRLAASYVTPNAPLPYLDQSIFAPLAVVGSGGAVATTSGNTALATFASGAAATGLAAYVDWGRYTFNQPFFRFFRGQQARTLSFAMYAGDGQSILQGGGPPNFGAAARFGSVSQGTAAGKWQIAPLPVFPTRPAVPMLSNIDVMVFRHTQNPDQAAAFAVQLLSTQVQSNLLTYRGGLALRPAQATRQLSTTIGNVQGPDIIGSPTNDVTVEDWMGGAESDATAKAWGWIQQDLTGALNTLMGARDGNFDFGSGGPQYPKLPVGSVIAQTLLQAQQAANQGQAYPPPA